MAHRTRRGFTLIELMIVVAIIGVLAVLAIFGVRKYIANAKTAEARNALGQMSNDARRAYESDSMAAGVMPQGSSTGNSRSLCRSASATVPASAASIKGRKYQSAPSEWALDAATSSGFACLKFVVDSPQYFLYGYSATAPGSALGNSFTATANGDLNGDGVLSTFTMTGVIASGMVLDVSPVIAEVNPEE